MSKKPTIEDIKKKFKAYERYYERLHKDQRDIDEYYELTFDPGVPPDYPVRMPDTARNWVDAGVRHYTLDNPRVKFYARNNSQSARDQVAILETFGNFFLRLYIKQIKEAAKKTLIRGESFLEVGMDDTYLGQDSDERLFHFPLSLNPLEPINTYASPAHDGLIPHDIIKYFDITVSEALALCEENGWRWTTKKADDKLVKWLAFKCGKWRSFMIDDESILPDEIQPHILGFNNVIHINAGLGQTSYEGKPEYNVRSILYSKTDMLKLEARNLSQMDSIIQRYAYPRYKATLGSPNTDIIKQIYPDGRIPTDVNEWLYDVENQLKTEIVQGEQPPPALFEQLRMIKEYAAPPTVLSGGRPTGVYSGQHQETLISTAKPIYKEPFKNLEDGLAVAVGMGLRIIEKVYKYPVQLKNFSDKDNKAYITLSPDNIKGHYDCEVQLLAEPPEATDARKYLGANLRKGESISEETELKNYHDMSEKEAREEMARKSIDRAMKSPGMLEFEAMDAMELFGMEKQVKQMKELGQSAVKNNPPPKEGEGLSEDLTEKANTTSARVEGELAE